MWFIRRGRGGTENHNIKIIILVGNVYDALLHWKSISTPFQQIIPITFVAYNKQLL